MTGPQDEPPKRNTRPTLKLAAKASAGDVDAERLLHDHLRPWLLKQLVRKQPPASIDLEGVVQEAFIGLFERLDDLVDDPKASVRNMLKTIAKRRLIDAARQGASDKRKLETRFGDGETAPAEDDYADARTPRPSAQVRCHELLARLSACLPDLTPQRQQIVRLYLLEGRAREEVMEVLGLSDGAFRTVAQSRARSTGDAARDRARPEAR